MAISSAPLTRTGNAFLDALPLATRARLEPKLTLEKLRKGQVLAAPEGQATGVYFPIRSLISTVLYTESGAALEAGVAGHDGLSPLSMAFGSSSSRHGTVVQIPDSAYRIGVDSFLMEYELDTILRERCSRFAEYSFCAATQFAACNGVHQVEERYARWILMADDRVRSELNLTQEYLAQMLGVRRATVTTVALKFAKANIIAYRRGRVSILDRVALEHASCECYVAVNHDLRRLMGYDARGLRAR